MKKNSQIVFWFVLGLYIFQAFSSLVFGLVAWDEETDLLGIRSHIAHAMNILSGREADFRNIHSNLEYYGTVGFAPAWALWFLFRAFSTRLSLQDALYNPAADHQLTSYYLISHIITICLFLFLTFVVIRTSSELDQPYPYLAGSIILLIPSLVGHSLVNAKDITFCTLYTAYTLTLVLRGDSKSLKWRLTSILLAGLLVNSKFVFLLPLGLTEILFNLPSLRKNAFKTFGAVTANLSLVLLVALVFQPASWLVNPITYLSEAFNTFSTHQWGGCMSFYGSCIGRYHPEWSTASYIFRWISVKVPMLIVFLASITTFQAIRSFVESRSVSISHKIYPVVAQLLFIPILSIIGNSNLYDADRHLLFVYPPLTILSLEVTKFHFGQIFKRLFILVASTFAVILLLDNLSIAPYGTAYFNEPSRFFLHHENTTTDYWAISSKEAINKAQLNGSLPVNPVLSTGLWISPLWISYRQLGGHMNSELEHELQIRVRDPSEFINRKPYCRELATVTRQLLFMPQELVLSRLELCKKLS